MGRISAIPPGLLGSLGIQAQGANPNDLAGFYQPAIDMRDWVLAEVTKYVYCQATFTSVGAWEPDTPTNSSSYIVPQGEAWLLYGMAVTCDPGANVSGQPYFVAPSNAGLAGGLVPVIYGSQATFTPGNNLIIGVQPQFGLFLPQGSRPRFNVAAYAGISDAVNFFLHYARLAAR